MSDLRFIEQLGAEFERVAKLNPGAQRRGRPGLGGRPRITAGGVAFGFSVLVVIAVAAALLGAHSRRQSGAGANRGEFHLAFRAWPLDQGVPFGAAIDRAVQIVRARLAIAFPGAQVSRRGRDIVVVGHPSAAESLNLLEPDNRLDRLVDTTARLEFYDWEANALLPTGRTVASLGPAIFRNHSALTISQGSGGSAPGSPAAGSMNLYEAVKLASGQPARASADNLRQGPEYYMFGAPGSATCRIAGRKLGYTPRPDQHCLISGPTSGPNAKQELDQGEPVGANPYQVQVFTLPRGTVVLQATPASFGHQPQVADPSARFYVLEDHVALSGEDITNPTQSKDQSGAPDISFGFNSHGKTAFQNVTATISRRGQLISGFGQQLNQHFAVALDNQLITVPQIDFKQNPDGIPGDTGAQIAGGFSTQSARDLATLLRYGPLPVRLTPR